MSGLGGLFQNKPYALDALRSPCIRISPQMFQQSEPDAGDVFGKLRMPTEVFAKGIKPLVLIRPKSFA